MAWNFHNPDDPLEQVDIIIAYDLSGKKSQSVEMPTTTVRVLSIDDLIAMKRQSGRAQGPRGCCCAGETPVSGPGAEPVVQRFTDEYLERCRELSPADIVRFLEDYRVAFGAANARSRLISVRVPEPLLAAFKAKARLQGVRYQAQIKTLMRGWLAGSD